MAFASLLCLGTAAFSGSTASAAPIVVYGTGVTDSGALAAAGTTDTHYSILSGPTGASTPFVGTNIPGQWVANMGSSQWIGVSTNLSTTQPAGAYDFRTTFSLAGLNYTTASLAGSVAADNNVTILLNGVAASSANFGGSASLSPFTLSSGFINGVNTIDFVVTNSPGGGFNPSGLQVAITGSAAVPEPASIVMVGLGAVGVMGFGLRRRAIA